ncbi:MAG: hypothetical protein IPO77_07800 [Acidobacteria bacterium]|nr:hypothetical protein [Acidobacteriota bacterium]
MGIRHGQQEIISTPESKGMRSLHTTRGKLINASKLAARRGVGQKAKLSVPAGRAQSEVEYGRQKLQAHASPEAARALQLLQVDTSKVGSLAPHGLLRMQSDFPGPDDTEITRSDCQIAAGPDHLIVTVNAVWAIFDKSGRQLLRRNFTDMFTELIEDSVIFGPRIVYDQFRNGWVMAALARSNDKHRSWFLLAWSTGPDPLSDWYIWALDAGADGAIDSGYWADGLGLSVDNTSICLTANMFNAADQFQYSKLRVLNKKDLKSGGVLHGWDFWQMRNSDGTFAFGIQPALNMSQSISQFLLNVTPDGMGLTQWVVSQHSRLAPTLTRRFVSTVPFQMPPDSRQPETQRQLDTGDTRLGSVIFHHGFLWTAHAIAANWGDDGNVAAIQWFQINPRAGRIAQQGIYGAPHFNYFCPSLMVDGTGNMVILFNRASELEFPEIRYTGRLATDELNTLQESALLQHSLTAGSRDWSTCSGTANAPGERSIWMVGQYAGTTNDWATWLGAVSYDEKGVDAGDNGLPQSAFA